MSLDALIEDSIEHHAEHAEAAERLYDAHAEWEAARIAAAERHDAQVSAEPLPTAKATAGWSVVIPYGVGVAQRRFICVQPDGQRVEITAPDGWHAGQMLDVMSAGMRPSQSGVEPGTPDGFEAVAAAAAIAAAAAATAVNTMGGGKVNRFHRSLDGLAGRASAAATAGIASPKA